MIKVMTLVGTRPEIIRLSRVIASLDENVNHILVHTGQNYDYELNEIFFNDLDIRQPDYFLESAGANAAETIGNVITATDKLISEIEPDAFLILGDTNSCLAAISAKKRKIPIFHMEAGNRCFDQRVPEEINRKIIDHISDINLPYSTIARDYLIAEGIPPDRIVKTGSPMKEVLQYYSDKIDSSNALVELGLQPGEYFVFSIHREENVDSERNFNKIINIVNFVADKFGQKIIFSTHPRTRKQLSKYSLELNPLVEFLKPFAFSDYVCLQKKSRIVFSDSGTITEESSIMQFDAINMRESHERPEGMEEAAVIMSGLELSNVEQAISVIENSRKNEIHPSAVADYSVDNVSMKVLNIICSYHNYVNMNVWKKLKTITVN